MVLVERSKEIDKGEWINVGRKSKPRVSREETKGKRAKPEKSEKKERKIEEFHEKRNRSHNNYRNHQYRGFFK